MKGLEPPRLSALDPKSSVSAISPHPLVAIQAHLMPSLTNVSVGLVIAWLLLFACKFSLKIFGEVRLRSQNFLFAFTIKLSCFARLGQTLRVIPLAKWVALAYCKLPHLCKILRLAASCTARARLCIRFTTSASSSQRKLTINFLIEIQWKEVTVNRKSLLPWLKRV